MAARMTGDGEFTPYNLHSIRIPLGLVAYPGLSWGAKVLYGRLALFRGVKKGGFCAPRLDQLTEAMGASADTIDRWLAELIREGFLERKRRGPSRSAECIFLRHPALTDSARLRNVDSADVRSQKPLADSAELPNQSVPDSAEVRNQREGLIPQICGVDSAELRNHIIIDKPKTFTKNIHYSSSENNSSSDGRLFDIDNPPFSTLEPETETETVSEVKLKSAQNGSVKNGKASHIQEAIRHFAGQIYARHPNGYGRRDCSAAQVERKLVAILKHQRIPSPEQREYLAGIDRNHAAACASEAWQKEGGQYAKGLENWLAPTRGRYDVVLNTSPASVTEPPRIVL
jgi:hypothetical protein